MITLEVCVDSVESAVNAELGGAQRLELCADLLEGGTTPSSGLLRAVKEAVAIPVFCMVRPRGGDFVYTTEEFRTMEYEIQALKAAGADGLVLGVLTPEGHVDTARLTPLRAMCQPLPVTFHRAIDVSADPVASYKTLRDARVDFVLTSGGRADADSGRAVITEMLKLSVDGGPKVIVAGGIRGDNVRRLVDALGEAAPAADFDVHTSGGRHAVPSSMKFRNTKVTMGHPLLKDYEYDRLLVSKDAIIAVANNMRSG